MFIKQYSIVFNEIGKVCRLLMKKYRNTLNKRAGEAAEIRKYVYEKIISALFVQAKAMAQ